MGSKQGESILEQFKPKAGGTTGFDVDLAKEFPSTAFGSERRLDPDGNYATMSQMIKARYTFLAAQANTPEYNSKLLTQAVNDVTGGVVSQAGVKTIAPERGMTQARFDGVMAGLTDGDLAGATDLNGRPVSANLLRQQGRLEAIGPGRYMVNFAGPAEKPIYAYRGWGDAPGGIDRFVLDLTGRKPGPLPTAPLYQTMQAAQLP
jgi:hypothetical protein